MGDAACPLVRHVVLPLLRHLQLVDVDIATGVALRDELGGWVGARTLQSYRCSSGGCIGLGGVQVGGTWLGCVGLGGPWVTGGRTYIIIIFMIIKTLSGNPKETGMDSINQLQANSPGIRREEIWDRCWQWDTQATPLLA